MDLDAAAVQFRRKGYCVLPAILSKDELEDLSSAADALLDEAVSHHGWRAVREASQA